MPVCLALALLLAATSPRARRVTDDQGCDKGIDEHNELDGEIACRRNGVKTYEGLYRHGKREGVAKTWRDDGKLASVVRFVNGERSGLCEEYRYDTGKLEEACEYRADKKHGTCREYDRDGALSRERRYVEGNPRGPFVEYFKNGAVRERGALDDQGRRDGLLERFREDGTPEEATPYAHGKQHGTQKEWHAGGRLERETEWRDGQRHGLSRRWHENGQLAETRCEQHGRSVSGTGPCTGKPGPEVVESFYPSGKVRERVTYLDGKRHGDEQLFSPEGEPSRFASYRADVLDGPVREFKSGALARQLQYQAGKRHGAERLYFDDGSVSEEIIWKDDARGERTTWWMNGKKKSFEKPEGQLLRRQRWHDNGQLAREETVTGGGHSERREGLARAWNEQGDLVEESSWKKGREDGLSRRLWPERGKARLEETFAEGVRTAAREWNEKGELTRDERYNADGSRK